MSTITNALADGPMDVDLVLVLAVDVSESIDEDEFAFQRSAIAAALKEPEIVSAVSNGYAKDQAHKEVETWYERQRWH